MKKPFHERTKELKKQGFTLKEITQKVGSEGLKTLRGSTPSMSAVRNALKTPPKTLPTLLSLPVPDRPRWVCVMLLPADALQETLEEVYRGAK